MPKIAILLAIKSFVIMILLCIFLCFTSILHASCDPVETCKKSLTLSENTSLAKAIQLLHEQQQEQSFCEFFKALELAPTKQNRKMSIGELTVFNELLPLYSEAECHEKVTNLLQQHPEYASLLFFLASGYANQHKFEPFFYLFYSAYLVYPKSYLSYKMQGVLATLVVERAKTPEEKSKWKNQAMQFFRQAFNEYMADVQLHKMMIYTANDEQKKEVIQLIISKIVEKNVQISRSELPFYITHALRVQDYQLAENLLCKARGWYEYSRIIDQLQQQIEESKHGRKP